MTNDSTASFRTDFSNNKAPRQSTLLFIRQFARVYMNLGSPDISTLIIN